MRYQSTFVENDSTKRDPLEIIEKKIALGLFSKYSGFPKWILQQKWCDLLARGLLEEQTRKTKMTHLYAGVSSEIITCGFKMTNQL